MSGEEQDVLDAGASGFLASNHVTSPQNRFQRSKVAAEIKRFEGRLRVLEEEAQVLRGVFLEGLEGRAKIMAEIYEKFENIQHCLMLKQLQTEERWSGTNGDQIVSRLKDENCKRQRKSKTWKCIQGRRAGLLQVLRQEPNPSLVNRGLKAKALA